jgi:hypothetical protein
MTESHELSDALICPKVYHRWGRGDKPGVDAASMGASEAIIGELRSPRAARDFWMWRSQLGELKRCRTTAEESSITAGGTLIGSCEAMTTLTPL